MPFADHGPGPADPAPDLPGVGFAEVLRARRRAAGVTQEELAARAGLGVRTLRELERGRVARPQRGTVTLLADALGLTGALRGAFIAASSVGRPAAGRLAPVDVAPVDVAPGESVALAALPELIGRDADLAELVELLDAADLVTLVGLAGVGKSSLALAVAHRLSVRLRGVVAVVPVADVSAREDLLAATASAFGAARAVDLAPRLADAPALLVLDGIDRSPRASVAAVRWLRGRVPTMRVLATGRHPLGVPGGTDWRVEPLDVPPETAPAELAALRGYPAVNLFLTRLRRVRRTPVHEGEAAALAGLVRRLGGLPMALELAAARGRVLELPELLERYGDRILDLAGPTPGGPAPAGPALGPGSDRWTLREAVAASYHLLDGTEQYALRRLCVLRGRWSLDLAEALLAQRPELDVETVLDRLVGLGLVSVRGVGELRFQLLDMVGDFARERCREAGEWGAARNRHAEVFAGVAGRISVDLVGPTLPGAAARLDEFNSDIRAALGHASRRLPHTALRLAAAIPRWCRFRGRDREARALLRSLLDDARTADAEPLLRARAQLAAAMLAAAHGEGPVELPATEAALDVFVAHGDVDGELTARNALCGLWQAIGGYDEARRHGEAILALALRAGRVREIAVAQNNLTWHDIRVGDLPAAARRLAVAARRAGDAGDERIRALVQANLAEVVRLDGRHAEAVELGRRAATALAEWGDPSHRVRVVGIVGQALAQAGRVAEARLVIDELTAATQIAVVTESAAGARAMISGYVALIEEDQAAAWTAFAEAADRLAGRHDARDVLEALVGMAAACGRESDRRSGVAEQIVAVCQRGGLTLLPRDRAMLG